MADFTGLPALPALDDVFIALGTTIKIAGSQSAFRAVDFDAVVAVARAARAAGATRVGVVSAMGADAGSAVFYNRVKGEMEQAIAGLGFASVVIARPSLIDGDRAALAQLSRTAEGLGLRLMRLLRPLIPANYRAVQASHVAASLFEGLRSGSRGHRVLLSGEMQ